MDDTLKLRGEAIEWRELDGEIVALETGRSLYLTANASGTLLWHKLAAGATRGDLVGALRSRYAVSEEVAQRDVDAFLAVARAQGLLAA
jgi:coenzyme PQQ synthesis protein D (PqqD)